MSHTAYTVLKYSISGPFYTVPFIQKTTQRQQQKTLLDSRACARARVCVCVCGGGVLEGGLVFAKVCGGGGGGGWKGLSICKGSFRIFCIGIFGIGNISLFRDIGIHIFNFSLIIWDI